MEATYSNSQRNHEDHCNPAFHIETTVASPILNIQSWEVFNQVTIPIRRIFAPAIIQTVPAVISKICLLTPYFIGFFIVINGLTVRFVDSLLVESRN